MYSKLMVDCDCSGLDTSVPCIEAVTSSVQLHGLFDKAVCTICYGILWHMTMIKVAIYTT